MRKVKIQRSVVPVYLIALWWAIGGFCVRIHRVSQFVLWILFSVVIFFVARSIFPDRRIVIEQPEQEPEKPEVEALRKKRYWAVGELRHLNENIEDPVLSEQIDHIEATTVKIFDYVMLHPEKKSQISRFLNYYLPTTIRMLGLYARMDDTGISGTNIDGTKGKIGSQMDTLVTAFDRLLDALYQGEAMDISAEIKVLDSLLSGDGLVDNGGPAAGK